MTNKPSATKPKRNPKYGKGRTDPDSWWKPGAPSPNPKGRPKGSKNQKTLVREAFNAQVVANIDGKPRKMSKRELGYHQIAQQAASGDYKALKMLVDLDGRFDPPETAPPTAEESAADFDTLDQYVSLREKFRHSRRPEKDDE